MSVPSYIFGGNTGETAESVKRKRAAADALFRGNGVPQNLGEGISAIGEALLYRMAKSDADKAEGVQKSAQAGIWEALTGAMGGGAASSAPSFPADPNVPADGGSAGSAAGSPSSGSPNLRSGIISTAQSLGIDPVDLGTAISYETAGTFDPTKKGPTTQWGQHKGLIQFGEPQARKYGVDWSNPLGSQLGPDGAVANYLRDTGVKPGMGMLDIYSAINAGAVGRYGASDANNGGAPGNVRDKVEKQMGGHRAKAVRLLGALDRRAEAPSAPQGVQVASADPGFMPEIPAAPAEQPMQTAGLFIGTPEQYEASQRQNGPSPEAIMKALQGPSAPAPEIDPREVEAMRAREAAERASNPNIRPAPSNAPEIDGREFGSRNARIGAALGLQAPAPAQMSPVAAALNPPTGVQPPMPTQTSRAPALMAALDGQPQPAPPMPPAQTVGPNPVPPGMDDPRFDPRTSQAARQEMLSGRFDGFSQNTGSAPAPAGGGIDERMLMSVLANPVASDDQRQVAMGMLQDLRRQKSEATKRAYDVSLQAQEIAREDQRFGVTDARENERLAMERARFEREGRKPLEVGGNLLDPQTMQPIYQAPEKPTNDQREYEFARTQGYGGSFIDFQREMKKAGATTINNVPPGGAGVQLPAEMGARIGMGDAFLKELPGVEGKIRDGAIDSWFEAGQLALNAGEPGKLWRTIETGRDALVRNLTGAGMSESEAANQTARYQITATDSQQTMLDKLSGLKRDLEATRQGAIGARTGGLPAQPPGSAPAAVTDTPPPGVDPEDWKFMSPEDRALFR